VYVASSCSFVNQWTVAAGGDVVRLRLHHTILYASSAWWGFAGASDRQRLAAFIRRSDRSRFVPTNLPAFADLCHDADEKMFAAITSDRHHVLHHLPPPQSTGSQNYNLRQRTHNFALISRSGHLTDNNFIQRMLYFDVY